MRIRSFFVRREKKLEVWGDICNARRRKKMLGEYRQSMSEKLSVLANVL